MAAGGEVGPPSGPQRCDSRRVPSPALLLLLLLVQAKHVLMRRAGRAPAGPLQPAAAGTPPPPLQAADPSWELPLDYISSLIADERKRLSPVPEGGALRQERSAPLPYACGLGSASAGPAPADSAGGESDGGVNPFMQQALAIATGAPYAPPRAPSPPGAQPASVNLPPLPPAAGALRAGRSLDLQALGARRPASRDPWGSEGGAAPAGNPALAFTSALYASTPGTSAGSQDDGRHHAAKRPASVLDEGEGEDEERGEGAESSAAASGGDGEGARAAGGSRAKYRSVSFDQPRRLVSLRSCPEAEFRGFWNAAGEAGGWVFGRAAAGGGAAVHASRTALSPPAVPWSQTLALPLAGPRCSSCSCAARGLRRARRPSRNSAPWSCVYCPSTAGRRCRGGTNTSTRRERQRSGE